MRDEDNPLKDKYGARLEGDEEAESDDTSSGGNRSPDFGDFPDMGVESSVKKEWTAMNFYLPDTHIQWINEIYRDLRYETDDRLQKGRHFYPLLVVLGMEQVAGMEVNEIKERLERMDVE